MPNLCPYCRIRHKKRSTCGHPDCQYQHNIRRGHAHWQKKGKMYNQRRKIKDAHAQEEMVGV
jgi:hypothetical protein